MDLAGYAAAMRLVLGTAVDVSTWTDDLVEEGLRAALADLTAFWVYEDTVTVTEAGYEQAVAPEGAAAVLSVRVDATSLESGAVMPMTTAPMENLRSGAYRLGSQSEWYLVPANDGSFGVTMMLPGDSDSGEYDDTAHVYGSSPMEHPVWAASEIDDWRRLAFSYVLGTYSTDPEDGSVVGMAAGPVPVGTRPIGYSLTNMRYNTQARVEAAASAEAARQSSLALVGTLEANANLALEVMDVVQVTDAVMGWSSRQFRVRRIEERWERGRLWQKLWLGEV